jgi:hypothetical protein
MVDSVLLVNEWYSDGRIWGRFADALAERYEVRRWQPRDSDTPPAGEVDVVVAQRGVEHAALKLVTAGRVGRAVLVLPEVTGIAWELSDADRAADQAKEHPMEIMKEFMPMMAGDFPATERQRMVRLLTAYLEPLLAPTELALVREVMFDMLVAAERRGAELRDGLAETDPAPDRPDEQPWTVLAKDVGDRLTVLTGDGMRSAGPVLERLIPGARIVELAARSDYPWLEDPAEVIAAIG